MNPIINAYAAQLGLPVTSAQVELLEQYAQLVWQKKDMLNLTSASGLEEIYARHICDGLQAAAYIQGCCTPDRKWTAGDAGSGAGYIGITCAAVLPGVQFTLVESLQRRCAFMNWAVLQLGLPNVKVANCRLGQGTRFAFDFLTQRAMGKLNDILPICAPAVQAGGKFIAYQGETPDEVPPDVLEKYHLTQKPFISYVLPKENKKRCLSIFEKGGQ